MDPKRNELRNAAEQALLQILRSPMDEQRRQTMLLDLLDQVIDAAIEAAPAAIAGVYRIIAELVERDPGNLRARAATARAKGQTEKAERLEAAAAEIESRH